MPKSFGPAAAVPSVSACSRVWTIPTYILHIARGSRKLAAVRPSFFSGIAEAGAPGRTRPRASCHKASILFQVLNSRYSADLQGARIRMSVLEFSIFVCLFVSSSSSSALDMRITQP